MKIGVVLCLNAADHWLLKKPAVLRRWGKRLRRVTGVSEVVAAVPHSCDRAVADRIIAAGWRCHAGAAEQLPRLLEAAEACKLAAVVRLGPGNLLLPDPLLRDIIREFIGRRCRAIYTENFPAGMAAAIIGTPLLRVMHREDRKSGRSSHPVQALRGRAGVEVFAAEPAYWCRGFAEWRGSGRVVWRGRGERVPALDLTPNTPITRRWSGGQPTPPVAVMVRFALRRMARRQAATKKIAGRQASRRNILMLNHTAIAGGAEHSLLETANGLRARGWRVSLGFMAPGPMEKQARHSGYRTAVFDFATGRQWPGQLQLARYLDEQRIGLVYANAVQAVPPALLPALERRLELVAHIREFLDPADILRSNLGAVSAIIANSRATADCLRAYVEPARLTVIHNGLDPERVRQAAAGKRCRLPVHEFTFGVFGRLVPYKGQHTAIAALHLLRQGGLEAGLVIAGSGCGLRHSDGYEDYLRKMIRALRLERQVFWRGHATNPFGLMAAVDAVAVPTEGEPFGRVILEALALGKPVIATADGGPAEILPASCLVPSADPAALARALRAVHAGRGPKLNFEKILARHSFTRYLDRLEALLLKQ